MRSELIKQIFLAFSQGDKEKFIETAHEIVKEEERKSHHLLAKDLKGILKDISNGKSLSNNGTYNRYKNAIPIPRDTEKGFPLLEIQEFYLDWDDVILSQELKPSLEQIVEEIRQAEILATYNLQPKQKILFCGPPGTGKTLSAQVLSSILSYPLLYIRFDSIVSSFLGETASNLRKIFNFIKQGQWIVLFDEFDVIGKHRDDPYEHGEIKRVVNNFMQMLDSYKGESLLIAATNHQHLLDPGLWRRFDDILFFDIPDEKRRKQIFLKYLRVFQKEDDVDLDLLVRETENFSPADIARICWEASKKSILEDKQQVGLKELQWGITQQKRRKKVERTADDRKI
jgi:SpoVK/Ycf46/Vps4 family AAA+-type ATPase